MAYVVTKSCLGTLDRSCCEVCPVDCFYHIKKRELNDANGISVDDDKVGMLMIHPDECINCAACETECPVEAIFEDSSVPQDLVEFIKLAEDTLYALSSAELDESRATSK